MGWNEEPRSVKGGERVLTRCCFGAPENWGVHVAEIGAYGGLGG